MTTTAALVRALRWEADAVLSLVLEPIDSPFLPTWAPGAHIDLHLPDGSSQQYSLCGSPSDPTQYRIAVLNEREGRGGSAFIHSGLRAGQTVHLGGPRNHFALEPAANYLFIAGGIGITPLLPMLAEAERRSVPWRLVYFGATRSRMAFLGEIATYGDRVTVVAKDEAAGVNLEEVAATLEVDGLLYLCGPERMSSAARAAVDRLGRSDALRVELFAAPEQADSELQSNDGFTVRLTSSHRDVFVPADRSILEVVLEAGIDVLHDCAEGICGSCETTVVEGTLEHRDYVLTEREKAAGDCMMICVSRSRGPLLELAL